MSSPTPDILAHRPGAAGAVLGPEEFSEHFRASSRALWCIAVSVTSDRAGAEDAVQEAAVIALGKLSEFTPGSSFVAWMGQIVRYVAMNASRKEGRRGALLRSTAGPEARSGLSVDPTGLPPALNAAMADLDETARTCLLLRIVGGMSYQQISAALGVPEGTAMSHVFRARKSLAARVTSNAGGAP
jgi:RNA polymerase sigma-70 factor (ECF subfamily)